MVDDSIVKKGLVAGIIAGIFILSFLILQPILVSIIFGVLFAYMFSPIFKFINKYVKGRTAAAAILMLLIILVVVLPIVYWTPGIVRQTFDTYSSLKNYDFTSVFDTFVSSELAQSLSVNFDNFIGTFFSSFLNQFTNLLINLPSFLLQFAVFLFTFFFVIRDSEKLKEYLSTLSPFSSKTETKFMNELRGITNALVFGQVLIGLVQGLALGAGFFLLGVPNALVLTLISVIVCMIPFLGSGLVWGPVSLFLLITGDVFSGIFLFIYGMVFVSSLDNIIRPYVLSRQSTTLPIPISIIGTIGGLYFFGIIGLVLGPLILAYALIIIEFYQQGKLNELFRK